MLQADPCERRPVEKAPDPDPVIHGVFLGIQCKEFKPGMVRNLGSGCSWDGACRLPDQNHCSFFGDHFTGEICTPDHPDKTAGTLLLSV